MITQSLSSITQSFSQTVIYTRESDCDSQSECDGDTNYNKIFPLKNKKVDEVATYHCHFKLEGKKEPSHNNYK